MIKRIVAFSVLGVVVLALSVFSLVWVGDTMARANKNTNFALDYYEKLIAKGDFNGSSPMVFFIDGKDQKMTLDEYMAHLKHEQVKNNALNSVLIVSIIATASVALTFLTLACVRIARNPNFSAELAERKRQSGERKATRVDQRKEQRRAQLEKELKQLDGKQ